MAVTNNPAIGVIPQIPTAQVGGVAPQSGGYERDLLSWVRQALEESKNLIRSEDGEEDTEENKRIVMGDYSDADARGDLGDTISKHKLGRLGKNIEDLAAGLTDFKPTGSYRTFNTMFKDQSELLGKLLTAWWYEMDIDLKIQLAVKQSLVARSAYVQVVFNPTLHGGLGDVDLAIRDYHDVLPIRPNSKGSIQDAVGVIIHSRKTVNWGKARYPNKRHLITATHSPAIKSPVASRKRKLSVVERLNRSEESGSDNDMVLPMYDHYEIYLHDDAINGGEDRVWIGPGPEGENAFGYWVEPKAPLYPRGRYIVVSNMAGVLFDGGNPYWHGMFPVIKLTLNPWPWSFLGQSALADAKDAQFDAIEISRGITDQLRKVLRPGVIADSTVPRGVIEELDTREDGWKLIAGSFGPGAIEVDKPGDIPVWVRERLQELKGDIDHVMGVLDMRALAQLKLTTMTDVETLLEHLGPSVKARGRVLESFVRELCSMMIGNFFQFWDKTKRIQILGPSGMDIEDFKFDPNTLVPALAQEDFDQIEDKGERTQAIKEFFTNGPDGPKLRPRAERAQQHVKSFHYYITPNSLLQIAKTQQKLLVLQLFRMGAMDMVTLLETLDIPNPEKVLERLQQAQQSGLTGAVSAAGRKSSGQEMPSMQLKDGGTRSVMSESG